MEKRTLTCQTMDEPTFISAESSIGLSTHVRKRRRTRRNLGGGGGLVKESEKC